MSSSREASLYLREAKSHGSRDYPIEYYQNAIPESYTYMHPHWHEEFEFTMVADGMLFYTIGQERYTVKKGDLLLIGPDTLHSAQYIEGKEAVTKTIVFHLNLVGLDQNDRCSQRYIRPYCEHTILLPDPVVRKDVPEYAVLQACFSELWKYQDPDRGEELLVKAALYRLIHQVWAMTPRKPKSYQAADVQRNIERLKPVLSYIHEHYMENLTIDELADRSGFSAVHFMGIFKKVLGTSCMRYVQDLRINEASAQLKETDIPVIQIALNTGFPNISYFNRRFRAYHGCTPTEYRKKYRK